MLDKRGRNIDYLRISLTDRCNLRCVYCMPEDGVDMKYHEDILRFEEIEKIIDAAASLGVKKVRFTGGEPLILKDIEKLIAYTASIPTITDIGITTNGILLAEQAEALQKAGLTRVNISLDTLNKDKFKEITRGGDIDKVFQAIDKCMELGMFPIKLNTVLMRGFNDDEIDDFIDLTNNYPIQVRFIELMPLGQGALDYKKKALPIDEVIAQHPQLIKINDKSKVAQVFQMPGALGSVGFISPVTCKFCKDCNRIRLTASGTIKPCLHSEEEINLRPYLDDKVALTEVLMNSILDKPEEHHLETDNKSRTNRMMFQIGG